MKTICLYFQVHQPFRLRRYRFFDIGNDHYYYDDYMNESIVRKISDNCYLPTNKIIKEIIEEYGSKFKVAFSISGLALDQFELYAPDVLESFKELSETDSVEFLAETYAHSLVSLKSEEEFRNQVTKHQNKIEALFGKRPQVFRNTELIYSDEIGAMVHRMGFKSMLTEGAKHILGWKSPNYMYCNALEPKLKILLKNYKLSDDIAFRFSNQGWSEYPLTTEKFVDWLNDTELEEETVNIFMDYETFGEHQPEDTGIFDFLKSLPTTVFKNSDFTFGTPSEITKKLQPISSVHVPHPISWADEERDLTAWLGNELQEDAFNKLYDLSSRIRNTDDMYLIQDWEYLQSSDHFYYMCTKFFSDGDVHSYFNPYESPYDAYINYMNVLSDFTIRLNASTPISDVDEELARLSNIIKEKDEQIAKVNAEVKRLRSARPSTKRKTTEKKVSKEPSELGKTKNETKTTSSKKKTTRQSKSVKSK